MEHILNANGFLLMVKPQVFENDIACPSNTILEVSVQSDGFSASTTMDIDGKELSKFSFDLTQIYETLSGEAILREPYGRHMYLSFVGNRRGQIAVKGHLCKSNRTGHEQVLSFESEIDQTCLKEFCHSLQDSYGNTY